MTALKFPPPVVLEEGICICIYEPRGSNGLEGYMLNCEYKFQRVESIKRNEIYYRVFPTTIPYAPLYYETCSQMIWKKYFVKK